MAVTGFGGSGVTTGARSSGVGLAAAGAAPRGGAGGLGAGVGVGRAGATEAGSPLTGLADPGTGNTSKELKPGGMLAIQTISASTMIWKEREPDMQTPSLTAGNLLCGVAAEGSGSLWARAAGLDRAGHGGKAGSLMRLFLPRVPPLSYGLLRLSENSPAGFKVSARPGEAARAGVEADAGTSGPADETGEVPLTACGAEGRAPTPMRALTGVTCAEDPGDSTPRGRRSAGRRSCAGRGSPNPTPAPPATNAQASSEARRGRITAPV